MKQNGCVIFLPILLTFGKLCDCWDQVFLVLSFVSIFCQLKKNCPREIVLSWIIIYFYFCQLSFYCIMIDAELMIIFHIYQCGIHFSAVTITEIVTKSMLYCNYKFNVLQNISLFKSVLKIYICKLHFCGSLIKKKVCCILTNKH